jgi:hypothetical protein
VSTVESFLQGLVTAMFLVAAVWFLRFWRDTRDVFFVAFSASFFAEGLSRVALLFVENPHSPGPGIYVVRLCGSLFILWAIVHKNFGRRR